MTKNTTSKMLTFREFYEICEGKKSGIPPHAVPGSYSEKDGVKTYTLQSYDGPDGPPTKKEVKKLITDRSGGKAVKQELKRKKKVDKKKK